MAKVSVITINYNGTEFVSGWLRGLSSQTFRDFELIVLDNGSTDSSLDVIRKELDRCKFESPVKIIPLDHNAGFARGNVVAFQQSEAEFVALLNNDTISAPGWLGALFDKMGSDRSVGICASKMIRFGTDLIDSAGDGFSQALKGFKRGEGRSQNLYTKPEFVFGACAGAALYRRKMMDEIGFFDEDFFLIQEDTDLNLRAQLAGWKVLFVPEAVVYHKVRSTIGEMSDTAVYYTLRNSEWVRLKNIPFAVFLRCLPLFLLGALSEFIYFALRHGRPGLYFKAKKDALSNISKFVAKRKKVLSTKKVGNRYLVEMMTPFWNREFFSDKVRKLLRG